MMDTAVARRNMTWIAGALIVALLAAGFWYVQPLRAQESGTDLETFRQQAISYYADLEDSYGYVVEAGGSEATLEGTRSVQHEIRHMADDDLALLQEAFDENPVLWELPGFLRANFGPGSAVSGEQNDSDPGLMAHSCPDGTPQGILDVYIAKDVAQGIAFAVVFAPNDLVTVSPAGGGTVSAHPVKIALQTAYEGAQTAALVLEQQYEIADECQTDDHRAILHDTVGPRMDVTLSTRASQESLNTHDEDIKGAVDVHDGDIKLAIAEHDERMQNIIHEAREENLRFFLESNLEDCTSVPSMYLPEAHGGYLERAEQLVGDSIVEHETAGLRAGQASRFHGDGVNDMAAGDYKQAYSNFCRAFTHLAQPGPR